MDSVIRALEEFQSPDDVSRRKAEEYVKDEEERRPAALYVMLSQIAKEHKLGDASGNFVRQQACLWLKNAVNIDLEDLVLASQHEMRWTRMGEGDRKTIKENLIEAMLNPPLPVRTQAAAALAKIATMEVPAGEFPDLIPGLIQMAQNATEKDDAESLVIAIRGIGMVCEEVEANAVEEELVNDFLTIVVQPIMDKEMPSPIRRAAMSTLDPLLEFARPIFETDERAVERTTLIDVILDCAREDQDTEVQLCAFRCIATLAQLYFHHLGESRENILLLTSEAAAEAASAFAGDGVAPDTLVSIACLALEFWTTVAEREASELEQGSEHSLICSSLDQIVPLFFSLLLCRDLEEDPDDEEPISLPVMASSAVRGTCEIGGVDALHMFLDFAEKNFGDADWRKREAACMCLSSVLEIAAEIQDKSGGEGKACEAAEGLANKVVTEYFTPLMESLASGGARFEQSALVRDTACFCVGIILRYHSVFVPADLFEATVLGLQAALDDHARVAAQAAFALHCLAKATATGDDENMLTPYFETLLEKLLVTYDRDDADKHALRSSTFETMEELVSEAGASSAPVMVMFCTELCNRLVKIGEMAVSVDQESEKDARMSHHIALIGTCVEKAALAGTEIAPELIERVAELIKSVYVANLPMSREDSVTALQKLADVLGEDAVALVEEWWVELHSVLDSPEDVELCKRGLWLCSSFAQNVGDKFPRGMAKEAIDTLLRIMGRDDVSHELKPAAISVIGDVALAVGPDFQARAGDVCHVLSDAAAVRASSDDEVQMLMPLREALLACYQAVLEAFNEDAGVEAAEQIHSYVQGIVNFVETVYEDTMKLPAEERDDSFLVEAATVLGDLACVITPDVLAADCNLSIMWINNLLRDAEEAERRDWQANGPKYIGSEVKKETNGEWARSRLEAVPTAPPAARGGFKTAAGFGAARFGGQAPGGFGSTTFGGPKH